MRGRYGMLVALLAVMLAIGVWMVLRQHPDVGAQPAEALPVPAAAEREANQILPDAVADVAAGTTVDGVACIPAKSSAPDKSDATMQAEAADIRGRLLASTNPEHLVAAALLLREPDDQIAPIKQALETGGDNLVVVWTAARICSAAKDQDACPAGKLAERLIAIDPLNSETWMFAAVQRLKRGDEAGALAAVQRAGSATESRIYWAETIALMERAYASASEYGFVERANDAMGVASANLPRYSDYTSMCTKQSQASEAWAYACLGYAELAERRGDTILGESIARAMQKSALKRLGDQARLAEVVAREERAEAPRRGALADREVDALIFSTPDLFADYLDVLSQQGESAALRWRRAETTRLRAELPPCASP
jgi:hypothetical protein